MDKRSNIDPTETNNPEHTMNIIRSTTLKVNTEWYIAITFSNGSWKSITDMIPLSPSCNKTEEPKIYRKFGLSTKK
jgi:hypothetical protein